MLKCKKYSSQVVEKEGAWCAEILRRVTSKKTHISKQKDDFATETEAKQWAEKELKSFYAGLRQRNIQHSNQAVQGLFVNNNDVLRRVRYTFDFSDAKVVEMFGSLDHKIEKLQVVDWLKKDDDPSMVTMKDKELAIFLNALIIEKRGKKDGPQPEAEKHLNNNIIFRKLKIALDLKAEDVLEIMALVEVTLSKHELSAFFRKPGHKHYRDCKDQFLRNFLHGIQLMYRDPE